MRHRVWQSVGQEARLYRDQSDCRVPNRDWKELVGEGGINQTEDDTCRCDLQTLRGACVYVSERDSQGAW